MFMVSNTSLGKQQNGGAEKTQILVVYTFLFVIEYNIRNPSKNSTNQSHCRKKYRFYFLCYANHAIVLLKLVQVPQRDFIKTLNSHCFQNSNVIN